MRNTLNNKEMIKDTKDEAIAIADKLGHKLKNFKKYKGTDVYYAADCARCSAGVYITEGWMGVVALSGTAVERQCQQLCICGQPLTPVDLDGQCEVCRGNQLTLYPKTSVIREKEAHFIEYCRNKDREYEPDYKVLSDFFWHCQCCYKRLGLGFQGDPDERGYCNECSESLKISAKRKADAIEAAGGLKAWQRKRLIAKLLLPIDYVTMIICIIAVLGAGIYIFAMMLFNFIKMIGDFFAEDWISLAVIGASLLWVTARWKTLNAPPREY